MNILYLGYWSVNDGLTKSAIYSHLEILAEFDTIESLIFCSIERDFDIELDVVNIKKTIHYPLYTKNLKPEFLNKWNDFKIFPNQIRDLIKLNNVSYCIAAGTHAGTIALKAVKKTSAEVIVSYFDPHSDYMNSLGIWHYFNPRYLFLHYWEKKMKIDAYALFPVSNAYYNTLLQDGVKKEKLHMVPCTVDLEKFEPDNQIRAKYRRELGYSYSDLIGVYVGKFGDIYFSLDRSIVWFKIIKQQHPNFRLVILTNQDALFIRKKITESGFADADLFIKLVPHEEVPAYLSAADLAFCLHKPHGFSHAYSPIKNGEYWACGLPVIIPSGVGDDSDLIKKTGLGVVVEDIKDPKKNFEYLELLINTHDKNEIRQLAQKNRNPKTIVDVYNKLL